jgi:hypothetical protein
MEAAKAAKKKEKEQEPFWDAWKLLCEKCSKAGIQSLTDKEREFYVMNSLVGSVERGGFQTYFDTHAKIEIDAAKKAFERNGHKQVTEAINRSERILFPSGIPEDFGEQQLAFPSYSKKEIEEDIEPEWTKAVDLINDEFYSISETTYPTIDQYFEDHILKLYKR